MKFIFVLLSSLLLTTSAFAEDYTNSSNVHLGNFNKIKCGTGMSCGVTSGKLVLTPSAVGGEILAANATDADLYLKADNSDDNGDDWKVTNVAASNLLTFSNDASGSQVVKMSVNTSGDVFGPGTGKLYGFINDAVQATATTITAAQCGKSFFNAGAIAINLPDGSAGLIGCRLTFYVANASNFDINPGNSDSILTLTNAAGDSIRNATKGGSVILQYGATNEWYVIGKEQGTWSDIN